MMGAEGPRGRPGKMPPWGRWGAEFDIRRPVDIPGEAEKPMGGQGHGHLGARCSGREGLDTSGGSLGQLHKQVKKKLSVRSV